MSRNSICDDIDVEQLIKLVSQNPSIWDKTLEEYHNRTATAEAWRNVCDELNPRFEAMPYKEKTTYGKAVLKKWRNVRDQWIKTVKKVDSQKKSGATTRQTKRYMYHEQLSFLKKSLAGVETESNYSDEPVYAANPDDNDIDGSDTSALPHTRTRAPTPAEKDGARNKATVDLDKQILTGLKEEEDPYVLFFKGIQPRMYDFSEDEHLQFQCGVLNLIQSIKRSRDYQPPSAPSCSCRGPQRAPQQGDVHSQHYEPQIQKSHSLRVIDTSAVFQLWR